MKQLRQAFPFQLLDVRELHRPSPQTLFALAEFLVRKYLNRAAPAP